MGGPSSGSAFGADAGSKSAEKKVIFFFFTIIIVLFLPHLQQGNRDRQSLIPVTVKQLLQCDNVEDSFRVDGVELFTVKIIGTVDAIVEQNTNHTFQVSDGSGTIECKLWVDKVAAGVDSNCSVNSLVRVCGSLREYEGRRHVLVYDMTRIDDWNELTHHMLGKLTAEFIYNALTAEPIV